MNDFQESIGAFVTIGFARMSKRASSSTTSLALMSKSYVRAGESSSENPVRRPDFGLTECQDALTQ